MNEHKMEKIPRIVTILGLVLEGLGIGGIYFSVFLFRNILTEEFFLTYEPTIAQEELDLIMDFYGMIADFLMIFGIVMALIFLVNLVLFSGLIRGKNTEDSAKKVYTYQFVLGIIYVFTNTLVGVLYIISGYQGRNEFKETKDIREGI